MIIASFAQQYGIRLRNIDDMPYTEFCYLLSGIMPETPLGSIVSIRSENNPKVIKGFTKEQKKIRNDWSKREAKNINENKAEDISMQIYRIFEAMAGGEDNGK